MELKPREKTIEKILQIVKDAGMLVSRKWIQDNESPACYPYLKAGLDILVERGKIERVKSSACMLYKIKEASDGA